MSIFNLRRIPKSVIAQDVRHATSRKATSVNTFINGSKTKRKKGRSKKFRDVRIHGYNELRF